MRAEGSHTAGIQSPRHSKVVQGCSMDWVGWGVCTMLNCTGQVTVNYPAVDLWSSLLRRREMKK